MIPHKPRLLILVNEPAEVLIFRRLLKSLNIEVIYVESGEAAQKEILNQNSFAILIDAQLEGKDGFTTASIISNSPQTSHIPIIFITAIRGSETLKIKGYESGAVDYLSKPIDENILISKIQVFLDLYLQTEVIENQKFELKQSNQKFRKITKQNIMLREEAITSSSKKSEFLASMSHEIRTPINGVMGMINLALHTELTEEQNHFMNEALTSAKSLLQIINDILDFSKIEAGKIVLEKVIFNIEHLINEIISIMKPDAENKGIELLIHYKSGIPDFVLSDPERIRQVLINIISNAIKFTNDGQISVSITATAINNTEYVFDISVADTGIGIHDKKKEDIFDKFNQADSSTTRNYEGTGLGLTICKNLVELMGGKISVESALGEGSTFSINLPMHIENMDEDTFKPSLSDSQSKEIESEMLTGNTILLVDDNHTNQMVATVLLKKCGCAVVCAANGFEAVNHVKMNNFDMVLMDCQMPGMNGYEATRIIREFEIENDKERTPIIAVTASDIHEEKDKCMEVGMDDYISKPVRFDDLKRGLIKWCPKK